VLIWVLFIPQLADFVAAISPAAAELTGKARMAAEVPRQIANAHSVFNVANTLLFLGFTNVFAPLVKRLVPGKPKAEEKVIVRPKYLAAPVRAHRGAGAGASETIPAGDGITGAPAVYLHAGQACGQGFRA
jgi:Na+/phosphate symporter